MFPTSRFALLALVGCAALISCTVHGVDVPTPTGGVAQADLTAKDMETLTAALSDDARYAPQVADRLCFTAVQPTFKHQIVNGWIDTFTVNGCVVTNAKEHGGLCPKEVVKTCTQKTYDVSILSRPWEQNLIQVTKIQSVGGPFTLPPTMKPTTPPPACPDKK